ncbi:hypothetical protein I302_109096 [Kwoniella bestiolae CBS 10118]|uniref:Uncharacterized protein n=1 Tax=Kwoniella bestiolae CBS 10118 TaxID=1296100 RepID=A0A1B9FUZ6_9TREE|nr:hypothetical protein I302_08241 [Kwoniella bestiolae CBS 10118]OCF22591.1 hypothetical protein I302_08241 [Kwoniella bestiolae CBS 10118]
MSGPPPSATRIVQSLLSSHPHMNTQQMYQAATEGLRPILRPAHVIDNQGRIRMKRVSNMREGRRPWVPMPTAPFPDHPFKSVNFLKRTILASLESQGLIHKARIERPIETDEERQEAIATAMRLTRKDERTAMRLNEPVPVPRIPKTTVTEYAWKMGSAPDRSEQTSISERLGGEAGFEKNNRNRDVPPHQVEILDEEQRELNRLNELDEEYDRALALRMQRAWEKNRGQSLGLGSSSTGEVEVEEDEISRRWDQAVRLEEKFLESQVVEQQQIEERQQARRAAFRLERERKKQERMEDELAGRLPAIRAERKRIEALEAIESYARQTGEDVSGWYEELGINEGEEIPVNEDRKKKRGGGGGGFGLKRDV